MSFPTCGFVVDGFQMLGIGQEFHLDTFVPGCFEVSDAV